MPDDVTSMFYNAENGPPWHGKGTAVRGLATAAECIREAGLDWAVMKVPIQLNDGSSLPLPDHFATVRTDLRTDDERRILGLVAPSSSRCRTEPPSSSSTWRIGEKRAIYETAGCIAHGRVVWLLARLPQNPICPVAKDEVYPLRRLVAALQATTDPA